MSPSIIWEPVLVPLGVALLLAAFSAHRVWLLRRAPVLVDPRSCPQCGQGVGAAVALCPICGMPTVASARRRVPPLSSFTPRSGDGRVLSFRGSTLLAAGGSRGRERALDPLGGSPERGKNRSTNTVEHMTGAEVLLDPLALRWLIVAFLVFA